MHVHGTLCPISVGPCLPLRFYLVPLCPLGHYARTNWPPLCSSNTPGLLISRDLALSVLSTQNARHKASRKVTQDLDCMLSLQR